MFNFGDVGRWIIPVAAIGGWIIITLYRLYVVSRTREHAHRERMAMIERGLQPPDTPSTSLVFDERGYRDPAARNRRTGIILIGVGVGLAVMLGVMGAGGRATGASAFLIVLGIAFLLIALFDRRSAPRNQDEVKRT